MPAEENKKIIDQVNASFDANDTEGFLSYCDEDIVWNMAGNETFNGVQSIRDFMSKGPAEAPLFTITETIAENQTVMSRGEMKMKNKDGKFEDYFFCDVYRLQNKKIIELTSYIVKHKLETAQYS